MSTPTATFPVLDTGTAGSVRRTIPRGLLWLGAASWLLLAIVLVRLTVFMMAPAPLPAIGWSVTPWNAFLARHACTTAYWTAATQVETSPDLYSLSTHAQGLDPRTGAPIPRTIGPHNVDPFEYPPTFLPLPRAVAAFAPDFPSFRRVWFVLNVAGVLALLAVVAAHVDAGRPGRPALLLAPLTLLPLGMIGSLQMGNVQLLFVGMAMAAMVAFDRRRHAVGGALLAYACVGKLFPGVLLLYLAVQRRWRAVGWTAGWAAVITLVTLADVGWAPFAHFLDHLPKLLDGEAFPMLRAPFARVNSVSLPGAILKLPAFGGPEMPLAALQVTGWIHTLLLLWVTVHLARRPLEGRWAPLAWLAVLALATLRSPFLPAYGLFQGAWMAALLLALCWTDVRLRWAVLALWLVFLPLTAGPSMLPPTAVAAMTTAQTITVLVLAAIGIRAGRRALALAGVPEPGSP